MLLAVLGLAIGSYLLIVLKNANRLIVDVNETLTKNDEKIDRLLTHLEELGDNTVYFSAELKKQFENNKMLVGSVFRSGVDSVLLLKDTPGRIKKLISNLNEVINLVTRFFKK